MSKFKVGDKVICVKNTPEVQEGWIGVVFAAEGPESGSKYDLGAQNETGFYSFHSDELELLSTSLDRKLAKGGLNTLDDLGEHTGLSVGYYKVHVANPTTLPEAYYAEANDIIEALGLTFAEGNLLKAVWRIGADRSGKKKKGNNSIYDAEKLIFFAERVLIQEKAKQ